MAGERMRVPGYGEVSGVCVDGSARGEGLGAAVTLAAAHGIRERGDVPMLHVRTGNEAGERLYERLGFEVRRMVTVVVARRPRDVSPTRASASCHGVGGMPFAWEADLVRTGRLLLRCRGGA